jgi:hypothetical protein
MFIFLTSLFSVLFLDFSVFTLEGKFYPGQQIASPDKELDLGLKVNLRNSFLVLMISRAKTRVNRIVR